MGATEWWVLGAIAVTLVVWFSICELQDRRAWRRILRETAAGRAQTEENMRRYVVTKAAEGEYWAQQSEDMGFLIAAAIVRNAREQSRAKNAANSSDD